MTSAAVRADSLGRQGVDFPCAKRVGLRRSWRRTCTPVKGPVSGTAIVSGSSPDRLKAGTLFMLGHPSVAEAIDASEPIGDVRSSSV